MSARIEAASRKATALGPSALREGRKRSWLIGGEPDRERMMDMDRRLRPVRLRTFAVLGVALAAASWWAGWWTLAPLMIAVGLFRLMETRIDRAAHPEYWMLATWAGAEAIIALSLALTGSSAISMLALLAIPVVTLSARFSERGVWVGVGIAAGLMVAVALGTDAGAIADNPPVLIAPLAVVVAVAMLSTALMRSDLEHRDKAILDPLTGLLNRTSLATRVAELEQQSEITQEPVGVIAADLDGFKQINDSRGHAAGDAVLTEVAYLLRKRLRAFDLAYRLGGDEFLILIPGADLSATRGVAVKVRAAIGEAELESDFRVTMSCGVSASTRGEPFDYERVFACADQALYEAKKGDGLSSVQSAHVEVFTKRVPATSPPISGRGTAALGGER
jgi:diguanylate cyclase (GGDEF)-like protein